jgi:TolB protein
MRFEPRSRHCPQYLYALIVLIACALSLRVAGGEDKDAASVSGSIAFVALKNDFWQVSVLNLATKEVRQLTDSPVDKRTPCWNREGTALTYRTSNGTIEKVTLETGAVELIKPVSGFMVDPRLSPSGKRLAFARFESDPPDCSNIYIHTFESKELSRITDDTSVKYAPAWAPDESRIAFIGGRGRNKNFLRIVDVSGKNLKTLQNSPSDDMCPAWSPDGQWIVFSSSKTGDYEIWRVRPSGEQLEILTRSPGLDSSPCFSPDGKHIVFTSNREGQLRIWAMTADGADASPLTAEGLPSRDPSWWQPMLESHAKE